MIRNEEQRVESVHRALVLLKVVAETGSLSVTDAAKILDVNPSTAQRLLATLAGDGFVAQGERKRYEPGPALLRPSIPQSVPPLRTRARPYLERLFQRVGETVHITALVGTEVNHLDGIEASAHSLRFGVRNGVRLPAHVTAAGRAMLADLPTEDVNARYQIEMGLQGAALPVDLKQLHEELTKTRRQQVATNFGESEPGVAAFAASIGVIDGERAAFVVALPIARLSKAAAQKCTNAVKITAAEAAKALAG
ncbi:IclR family transcriptional regulator [Arthrobacter sp. AK01]|uniref:IclR family transcriptional regulator n=1 Tax=Arthrobacter sp. AK01 TaxID=2894084 RepID=UPI001E4D3A1E|nr:IclR family transcriptional regulator [Arthrobacter sp. AK01]MCD4852644.1 IclR family transcriptional regulator [Arthrobacter sp. AK01]